MKKYHHKALALLLGALLFLSACQWRRPAQEEPVPPETPAEEAPLPPQEEEPALTEASPAQADRMLASLGKNLLSPLSATVRLGADSALRTQLNSQVLQELAGFLCQGGERLSGQDREPLERQGAITLEVLGELSSQQVLVQQKTLSDGSLRTIAQVQERDWVSQYSYDPSTYDAMSELLSYWQVENLLEPQGNCQVLSSKGHLLDLRYGQYSISNLLQLNETLLIHFDAGERGASYLDLVDCQNGRTRRSELFAQPVLALRPSLLSGYDYCAVQESSIHFRNSQDSSAALDFQLPERVRENLLDLPGQALFDLDPIEDSLVYISSEGLVLSNQSGQRQDLLLRHEHLQELSLGSQEAHYVSPLLLGNGRLVLCPILLEDGSWGGFSIFNLMNGVSRDYVGLWAQIKELRPLDGQSILLLGEGWAERWDVVNRQTLQRRLWQDGPADESRYANSLSRLVLRRSLDNRLELLLAPYDGSAESSVLQVQGDYFRLYGTTEDYALCGWSDSQGESMAVVSLSSPSHE